MTTIPVQTSFLRMAGIGVEAPPADPTDPHDLQGPGIHLRWSFPTGLLPSLPMPIGWPEAGFTLYRREAEPPGDGLSFDLPSPQGLQPDATLPLPGVGQLEFDPDALMATLRRVPGAATDLSLLLDAYPLYVTLRFAAAVRRAALTVFDRPLRERGPRLAAVRAHDGPDSVVDEASLVGDAPSGERLTVSGDHITHLRFRVNGLRITGVSYVVAPRTAELDEWTRIAELPPLTTWTQVRDRIPAEFQPAYEEGWTDLGAELERLFDPDDDRPRWLRTFSDAGMPDGRDLGGDEVAPSWSYSLQPQILLFSIDPFVARLLGLLYVDDSAEAAGGDEFDYLVVGTFELPDAGTPTMPPLTWPGPLGPGGLGIPDLLLERRSRIRGARRHRPLSPQVIEAQHRYMTGALGDIDLDPVPVTVPARGTVGWITHGRSIRRHPPLRPPELTVAETLPPRSFLPDPATGTLTSVARVGLAWTLRPEGDGGPLDADAVRYDVEARRDDDQGDDQDDDQDGDGGDGADRWRLLTPDAKVVVAASVDALGTPTDPEHCFVDHRRAGTVEYRVRGIDVFGRRSAPSRPLALIIADVVGPPAPVNLWTKYLDPDDPFLASDEAGLGQGLLVRFDYPRRPYEAGSDAAGFDLYTVNGPRDQARDLHDPASWGSAVASVPHQAKLDGSVTAATPLAGDDPAVRRMRVTTDLDGGATEAGGSGTGGAIWSAQPGHLLAGEHEYQVETVDAGPTAAFTLAWPAALGLPDPAPGPCTWYPGYQVFLPGYRLPLRSAPSVTGAVAAGATDMAGNRGRVSSAAAFQRVDRATPVGAGAFDLGAEELLASRPDAYGRSRFTLAWEPAADGARHLVYRALDAAVLASHGLSVADGRAMDAASLKALADDPAAEAAFSQLTPRAIDGGSYIDETLEGFGSNRYLYRLRPVSLAGVAGALGESSPPVAVPDVVPPARPTLIRALGGDGVVTLTFSPSKDWDADHYAVYRASDADAAADVRRMTLVGTVAHDPAAATLSFRDDASGASPPPPRVDHRYRVTAFDHAGNESAASRVVVARCFTTAPPPVPALSAQRPGDGTTVRLRWTEAESGATVLVQRQAGDSAIWQSLSTWLADGLRAFEDAVEPAVTYRYRLKAMNASSVVAESDPVEVPGR